MDLQSHNQGAAEDGTVKYHMYPGMFESTPMGEPLKTTKHQCELSCNEGPRTSARSHCLFLYAPVAACEGYSYRENTEMCSKTTENLSYDPAWMYAEKPPRTWSLGHPEDMKDLKDVDDSAGHSESFLKQFKYNRDTFDKKKAATMTGRVSRMVTASRASERKLRSLKTAILSAETKVARITTTTSKLVDSGRAISTRVETINGRLKTGNFNVELLQAEVNRFVTELAAERKVQEAVSLQHGRKLKPTYTDPMKLVELKSKLQNMKLQRNKEAGKLKDCEVDRGDLRVKIQMNDGRQIKALEALKKLKERFSSKKRSLSLMVTDAKNLKSVVDREFDIEQPPAFEPISPATYLDSWNDKADAAKAHIATDKQERLEGDITGQETFGMRHGKIKFGEKLVESTGF